MLKISTVKGQNNFSEFPIKFDTFEQLKMRIGSNNWDVVWGKVRKYVLN